jgi:hypothetical protein
MISNTQTPSSRRRDEETTMNALAHNAIAQAPVHGSWKLAVCASLALVITLLSARLIDQSMRQTYLQAAQATPALQLAQPVALSTTAPVLAARWNGI